MLYEQTINICVILLVYIIVLVGPQCTLISHVRTNIVTDETLTRDSRSKLFVQMVQ